MSKRQIENVTFGVGCLLIMVGMVRDSDFSTLITGVGVFCLVLGADIITRFKGKK